MFIWCFSPVVYENAFDFGRFLWQHCGETWEAKSQSQYYWQREVEMEKVTQSMF
jgi:hypothetical protein